MFKKKTFIMQCVTLALLYVGIYLGESLIDLSFDMIREKRHPEMEVLNFEQRRDVKLTLVEDKLQRIETKIRSQNMIITIFLFMVFVKIIENKWGGLPNKVETSETKNEDI